MNQDRGYNANVAGSEKLQGDALIHTIKTAINWVLGILSMIALVLCLWGGFQMMTSGGDQKKYESGLNVLKWAAIGLAIIAASWLIVSLIFFVINGSIKGSNTDITGNTQ
jgi:Na+-driven multidrug efflux pump